MGDVVGRVGQLWRFPVKSMQGAPVEDIDLGTGGVAGDRGWAVADPAAGKVLSAKRWPALLMAAAATEADGTVVITLPDGTTHAAGEPATDEALSAYLDHPVRVIRPPAGEGMPYELPTEAWDDSSPSWEFPGPPGGPFVDLAAAHLLTTASLRAAAELHPEGAWDVRRFRPTALIEADGDGFVEDAWVGTPVGLGGSAVLNPFMPTVRCALPTRAQPDLPRDVGIATTLNRHHDLNLGVYCAVDRPGTVRVGDPVRVGAPAPA